MRELLISNPQVSVSVENTPLEILEYLEMDKSNQFNMFSTKKMASHLWLQIGIPQRTLAQEATLPPLAPNSDLDLKEVPAWLKEADRNHIVDGMDGLGGVCIHVYIFIYIYII